VTFKVISALKRGEEITEKMEQGKEWIKYLQSQKSPAGCGPSKVVSFCQVFAITQQTDILAGLFSVFAWDGMPEEVAKYGEGVMQLRDGAR